MNLASVLTHQGRKQVWLADVCTKHRISADPDAVPVSSSLVSRWISGSRTVPDDLKPVVADALGTTVGYLFFDETVECKEHTPRERESA